MSENILFPIFYKLKYEHVVVIGGGKIAFQKILQLIDAQAKVTVISPDIIEEIKKLHDNNKLNFIKKFYDKSDIINSKVVIGATADSKVNEEIYNDANKLNIPVNIVDQPHLCTFYLGSVYTQGDLKIAVSSNGRSPSVAKLVRDAIKKVIPSSTHEIIQSLHKIRTELQTKVDSYQERKSILQTLSKQQFKEKMGFVSIVGAGPGDPELISIKGAKAISTCDVLIYDSLIHPDLLKLASTNAELLFVGKRCGKQSYIQKDIEDLMTYHAQKGKHVVRLKGGDPFMFGRGGEEVQSLIKHQIRFEIIPGISAGLGAAAYTGISLTHRKLSSGTIFITGHNAQSNSVDWKQIVQSNLTVVVYMGIKNAQSISSKLITNGLDRKTPVAIVQHATLPFQKTELCQIKNLHETIISKNIEAPAIIVIGNVVSQFDEVKKYILPPFVYNSQRDKQFGQTQPLHLN